ncbi:hypothetical protein [Streptomyces youssoufiensis]
MILVYAPDEGEAQRWDVATLRIAATEAEAVERVTGLTWEEVKQGAQKGSMRALRALAWVLVKRGAPTLRYGQFDPATHELGVDYDADERAAIREAIATSTEVSEDEREALLAQIDAAEAELAAADEPAPKESAEGSPSSVSATGP